MAEQFTVLTHGQAQVLWFAMAFWMVWALVMTYRAGLWRLRAKWAKQDIEWIHAQRLTISRLTTESSLCDCLDCSNFRKRNITGPHGLSGNAKEKLLDIRLGDILIYSVIDDKTELPIVTIGNLSIDIRPGDPTNYGGCKNG